VRIPGLQPSGRARRWLRKRFTRYAIILGYHRIAPASCDPFSLCVSPENFSDHLKALQRIGSPISLSELMQGLDRRQIPEKAVVITFDDGYADLLENAKPLLNQHQIPASVFVVADNLGRRFWWDRLETILFRPELGAEQLEEFIGDLSYDPEAKGSNPKIITNWDETARTQSLLDIHAKFRAVDPGERDRIITSLETRVGIDSSSTGSASRALSKAELIELVGDGGIEIGSHTLTHPWLADLSSSSQKDEIFSSKSYLESILNRNITSLAYPNGSISDEVVKQVKQAGYQCACTSNGLFVSHATDRFLLPRFWIPDWDSPTFEHWLRKWL
jgi:peptidoglycan/xylan/chitin deacetylase (PgdA/CDA1 family)